jgi:hypothetical protein
MVDPSFVPLFNRAERDVGEQRRDNPALGRAGVRPQELLFGQCAGLQELPDQSRYLPVGYASAYPIQ